MKNLINKIKKIIYKELNLIRDIPIFYGTKPLKSSPDAWAVFCHTHIKIMHNKYTKIKYPIKVGYPGIKNTNVTLKNKKEMLLLVIAHELRHYWQMNLLNSKKILKCRNYNMKEFNKNYIKNYNASKKDVNLEYDAERFSIKILRKYRGTLK